MHRLFPLPRVALGCLLLLSSALGNRARAESVIVPDIGAVVEDVRGDAAILSFMLRASLKQQGNQPVPRRELKLALEAVQATNPRGALTVPQHLAPQILSRLGATRIALLDLGKTANGLQIGGSVQGANGKRLARILVDAPAGGLETLAKELATRLAPALGLAVHELPPVGITELQPYVHAELAYQAGDMHELSNTLEFASPGTPAEFPSLREMLEQIADDPAVAVAIRAQVKLALGDWLGAESLSAQGLATEPTSAKLQSVRARALAGLKKFDEAQRLANELKGSRSLVALTKLTIGIARGDAAPQNDHVLAPLLGRPPAEWRSVLPIVATAPPGALGNASEAAALLAAEKLLPLDPALSTLVGKRALLRGPAGTRAPALIELKYLSEKDIQAIRAKLLQAEDLQGPDLALFKAIQAREEAAKKLKEEKALGMERPTGPPSDLAQMLQPYLQRIDGLFEPALTSLTLAPLPGSGGPVYWPFFVRPKRLHEGLAEAAMRPPWDLNVFPSPIATEDAAEDRFTESNLPALAGEMKTSGILLYRIKPAGLLPWVTMELLFYDTAKQRTERLQVSLTGRASGLVWMNPALYLLMLLAICVGSLWAFYITFRGAVSVRIQWDPDVKDELFCVLLSKSSKGPAIESASAFRKKSERAGQRKRWYEAWNVDQSTTFKGIPKGRWYVHLFGTYIRGKQVLALTETSEPLAVLPRKTALAVFSLESTHAEFKITVVDSQGPVENARVWIDDDRARAQSTAKDGSVSLKAAKGYHVFKISAHDLVVERPYHVVKSKVHEMTVNLVWERRQEFIARALERQVDDADQYRAHSPEAGHPAPVAARPVPPSDDVPFDLPAATPAAPPIPPRKPPR